MAVKWNGRMIASLMRKSNLEWNSGSVARWGRKGISHCAVGQLGRLLGASADAVSKVGNAPNSHGRVGNLLSNIFGVNDKQESKEAAAKEVERVFGDTVFDVADYEANLREAQKELFRLGLSPQADLEPDCKILEEVKREEEEYPEARCSHRSRQKGIRFR